MVCLKIVIHKLNGKNLKLVLNAHGKLTFKHVVGGVKLVDTDFTIKEEKVINNFKNFKDNKSRKEK